ncbi:hypothetical protein VSR34_38120, partial [Paraburkholderia sp. JHI2823]|uniref:hypothetical protein n=1 Tax=Paraburkholderia sp. JHI2823 TaxID=3112960 RepID=UPI00317264AC
FGAPNTNSGILRNRSTSTETAVHVPPETLFDFNRNPCSASPKYAILLLDEGASRAAIMAELGFVKLTNVDCTRTSNGSYPH